MSLEITWQNLTSSALLGTERQKPNLAEVDFFKNIDSSNPEKALLEAAALTSSYKQAGRILETTPEPKLDVAEPEILADASSVQKSLMLECLGSNDYLPECLRLTAQAGIRFPFDLLNTLLHANRDSTLREQVLPVLGARAFFYPQKQ